MEFYETDENRGYIGGGIIATTQIGQPINMIMPGKPAWGQAAKNSDRDFFNYSMKIGFILQDMPQETNRVDLDPDVKDMWGLPVARITNNPHVNDTAMSRWQINKNVEIKLYDDDDDLLFSYAKNFYTKLDWGQRKQLPIGLTTWLHTFYSTHKIPFDLTLEYLAKVSDNAFEKKADKKLSLLFAAVIGELI